MFLPEPTYQYDFIAYLDSGMGMIAILYLLVSTSISSLLVYPASTLFFFSYYYCAFGSSPIFLYKTYGSYNSGFKYRMHSSPYLASKSYSSPSLAGSSPLSSLVQYQSTLFLCLIDSTSFLSIPTSPLYSLPKSTNSSFLPRPEQNYGSSHLPSLPSFSL